MSANKEQIGQDRRLVRSPWKWIKRQYARWRRRQERRLLDDADKRNRYRGYVA